MKTLIVEDDDHKRETIKQYVLSLGVAFGDVVTAKDMADFMRKFDAEVSICVIDLRLPAYDGGDPDRNGIGVLQAIESKGSGHLKLLAISSFPDEFSDIRPQFESRGCLLVDYEQREVWQSVLKQMVIEVQSVETLDFVILCALRTERAPYTGMAELAGTPKFKDNLSRFDISIAGRRGTIIELPHMGLVDAAVVAGKVIEKFKPKVVAMSGVCAGFPDRAKLGQLLVSDMAYEYQSGKWSEDGFSQEPYQVPVPEKMRVLTLEILEDTGLLARLESGWMHDRPSQMTAPKPAAFTSGSAVIASEKYIGQVATYHRRVSGLDMEVYALHRAAHLASCKPDFICAKVVVDLAGSEKDDDLQPYGCMISARFVVELLARYFAGAH
ncbi:nucleoside phosphorylase [Brevundimonas sp. P7753]|uniref:5'-methylthioadenosine/S-adenosylhomocysteine nucleosidase family protein n=1 Tax=Brevundimonas sp. P7753 TaxID=2726982 RepID=UPI000F90A3F8|nr:nucleoside phosphorylase [Brevundimonas sp. P7753]NWE54331.1 nucleoside phosphorylase [Brevundimonas sp. P7753]